MVVRVSGLSFAFDFDEGDCLRLPVLLQNSWWRVAAPVEVRIPNTLLTFDSMSAPTPLAKHPKSFLCVMVHFLFVLMSSCSK
jgi:hypothetical protein